MRAVHRPLIVLLSAALLLTAAPAGAAPAAAEPAAAVAAFDPQTVVAQDPNVSYLGTPVSSRIITNMVLGQEGGVSMTYGVYRGSKDTDSPATFVVADTLTGEIVRTIPLVGADHATEIRRSVDGKIYMTTTGTYSLWVYDPQTTQVRQIGLINPESPADGYGWSMAAAENGRMYIGSYPKGLLYLYDPADDSITNLGRIDETQSYIRALAYDMERGNLYVGAGGSSAQIWKVEPDGTKTPLLNDVDTPGATDHSFISTFTFVDDRLFARGGLSELLVIGADDQVEYWRGDGKEAFGYQVTPRPDAPGRYIFTFQETFWEYDSETATTRDLGIPNNGYLNDAYWVELDDPQWPGWTMIAATNDGVVKLNLETGTSEAHPIDYRNPTTIQKILTGPDSLYASGYMIGLAPFDSATGAAGETLQSGQFESSAVRDGRMLLGTYGHGRLMEYDPATGAAPRQVFSLQAQEQDRPFGLGYDPVTDRAFMVTVPYYGHNQGALAVHDFTTGTTAVYKDEIVTEQSMIDVLHHDGLVYIGTTIDGGLGAVPSGQTDAHFIVFDPDTGQVVQDIIPVAGDEGVTGLMVGPDGLIWGVSEDTVFKYDPATEQIVYSEQLLGNRYGSSTVWAWAYLNIGADGNVYGTNRNSLFRIDAETMEYTRLVDRAGNYANVDSNGDVFFSHGVHLFRYDVPELQPVTPLEVVFTDRPGPVHDTYTIPEVEGLDYLVAGEVVAAGVYPGRGGVSVTAVATEGFVIADGATSEWSHTFRWGPPLGDGPGQDPFADEED
ncbi:hypothetical protein [Occultella gossypii]|uniref:Uncharacterized protein n=1 Tax=Occultella gossypii TaxID=2800820 RepID=A0ABS7SHX9_9MICO|nr:hypothetical protein [Occultella gossypii]MBZ2199543.1 hypothetical protein [Occultella gossypii]